MPLMLPAAAPRARSLTAVLPDVVAAITGGVSSLPAASSAIVFVVDGLGALQLRSHAGHARFLASRTGKKDVARSVFPTTTAAALTSLLTGQPPGAHGLVGYRVLDPSRDAIVNQLSGWEDDGIDPLTWQKVPTVFESEPAVRSYAIGLREFTGSGFSRATLRGSEYLGEDDLGERTRMAAALAASEPGVLVYCYLPELDKAGHRYGIDSEQWTRMLETVDAAIASAPLAPGVGALMTADHGMVDVPRRRHVLLRDGDPRLEGVAHLGGEPRLLHVYLEPGTDVAAAAARWEAASGAAADVGTRADAISAGLFGSVDPVVAPRIGDLLIAARGTWAFYDDRLEDKRAQEMIGQHGSVTPEETLVPLTRLGAFAEARAG